MEEPDDLMLIRSVARKDREAFEALYYRYAPKLGRYAFKLLRRREAVDEVMNDVMLAVWQDAARYEDRGATLSAWLFGITHNKVMKMLDRTARQDREVPSEAPETEGAALIGLEDAPQDPERAAIGHQLGAQMSSALSKLPAEQRAVIELAIGQGQSYEEIAQVMRCPVGTVKTRMFHARKRLASLLSEGAS